MSDTEEDLKILFKYYSNILDEWKVENMWAQVVDRDKGFYKIDNIPFYGPLVASDDIVFAEYDEDEQALTYRKTIEPSGNSVVAVVVMDKTVEINTIRDLFSNDYGSLSERANDEYFVMEIKADDDYQPIKAKLEELKTKGTIDYSEPCLSNVHKY
jgi:hypothetical protein